MAQDVKGFATLSNASFSRSSPPSTTRFSQVVRSPAATPHVQPFPVMQSSKPRARSASVSNDASTCASCSHDSHGSGAVVDSREQLGQLWREDLASGVWGPATGYWSYNSQVGAYATPEASEDTAILSWAEFASNELGADPYDWPALDYKHHS